MASVNIRLTGFSLLVALSGALAGCGAGSERCTGSDCDAGDAGDPGEDGGDEPDGGEPDGGEQPTVPDTETEDMLRDLGVDLSPDEPIDPNGEPLPEDYNPLGARNTSLFAIDELFFVGMTATDSGARGRLGLIDDQQAGAGLLLDIEDDAWTSSKTKAVAMDLDGDGIEEVVTVVLTDALQLDARVLKRDGGELAMSDAIELATFDEPAINLGRFWNGYAQLDAVGADLDGDGSDDLFVAVAGLLLQFQYEGSSFERVDERAFEPEAGEGADVFVRLAAGDLELSGRDELVVVASAAFGSKESIAQYVIVAGELGEDLRSGLLVKQDPVRQLRTANPVIADLDGDGVPEVAFAGRVLDAAEGLVVLVMNGSKHDEPYALRATDWQDADQAMTMYSVAAADLTGSGRDDILAGTTILRLDAAGELTAVRTLETMLPITLIAATGDYNGDHKDDLLYLRGTQINEPTLRYDVDGYSIVHVDSSGTLQIEDFAGTAEAITDFPTAVFANVDDDSPIVQFRGRELMFSDPTVLAVIAAPPAFEGGDQVEGGTVFGRSDESEVEETKSRSLSLGVGIGVNANVPLIGGVDTKASVTGALGWTTSHTRTIERTISYETGPDEDKVVFTTVPYDAYRYEVVYAPDEAAVGSEIVIAVPREPQTLSTSTSYYNQSVTADVEPVDERLLPHQIGEPFSYLTRADRDARIDEGEALYSELATVGVGSGSTSVTVSRSEGIGEGTSRSLELELEVSTSVAGAEVTVTAGASFEAEMTLSNTTGTFYEGTVGDIPEDRIAELGTYRFGVLAYPQLHDGNELWVVSYWVEE